MSVTSFEPIRDLSISSNRAFSNYGFKAGVFTKPVTVASHRPLSQK